MATIRDLVGRGVNVNECKLHQEQEEIPVLHVACMEGNSEVARILVEAGANVNTVTALPQDCERRVVTETGLTALHQACVICQGEVVRLLLEAGADTEIPMKADGVRTALTASGLVIPKHAQGCSHILRR